MTRISEECVSATAISFTFIWAHVLVLAQAYPIVRVVGEVGSFSRRPARFLDQVDHLPLGPKRGITLICLLDPVLAVVITEAATRVKADVNGEVLLAAPPRCSPASRTSDGAGRGRIGASDARKRMDRALSLGAPGAVWLGGRGRSEGTRPGVELHQTCGAYPAESTQKLCT